MVVTVVVGVFVDVVAVVSVVDIAIVITLRVVVLWLSLIYYFIGLDFLLALAILATYDY